MIKEAIVKIVSKEDLTYDEAYAVMNEIMSGETTATQNAAFLAALSTKSTKAETIDEIAGCAAAMRDHATKVDTGMDIVEIVGTGGDGAQSFNISTTAALVAAAGGVKVAKHGNRAASSRSGTADCLEALGVNLDQSPARCVELLKEAGMCFFFAQKYHTSMKYVGPIRKELGFRTVFNILGPLTNPASPKTQLLGVYDEYLVAPLAQVLISLGVTRGMVVYGQDKLDEISLSAPTSVCEIKDGWYRAYTIQPEDFGFARCEKADLVGGSPAERRHHQGHSVRAGEGAQAQCRAAQCRGRPVSGRQGRDHGRGREAGRPAHRQRRGGADPGKTHQGEQPPGCRRMTILDQLAAHARQRVAADQEKHSLHELKVRCKEAGRAGGERFFQAMKRPGMSFICEVKKASPSKGIIAPNFPYLDIARDYAAAGADAVSCLTEPMWFLGSDQIFTEIRQTISLPMIRKDFTVSEYQIYQARLMGADCVLLICALLDTATIAKYLRLCDELGLSALVEAHDAREIRSAIAAGARMIGVNNRNLKDFSVDFTNAARLRDLIPPEAVYVAESGVARPADVAALKSIGADAVLMGEVLMRAKDKGAMLAALREASK